MITVDAQQHKSSTLHDSSQSLFTLSVWTIGLTTKNSNGMEETYLPSANIKPGSSQIMFTALET